MRRHSRQRGEEGCGCLTIDKRSRRRERTAEWAEAPPPPPADADRSAGAWPPVIVALDSLPRSPSDAWSLAARVDWRTPAADLTLRLCSSASASALLGSLSPAGSDRPLRGYRFQRPVLCAPKNPHSITLPLCGCRDWKEWLRMHTRGGCRDRCALGVCEGQSMRGSVDASGRRTHRCRCSVCSARVPHRHHPRPTSRQLTTHSQTHHHTRSPLALRQQTCRCRARRDTNTR